MELYEGCDLTKHQKNCIDVLNDLHNIDVLTMQSIGIEYQDVGKAIAEFKAMKARIVELEKVEKPCD